METRLKTAEDFTIPKAYTLQKAEYVKELDSFALVLKHNLSGARILVFSNEDDNKVFDIAFRTPPKDATGVPHIIEHTVLCGSEKYPAKDLNRKDGITSLKAKMHLSLTTVLFTMR